MNDQQIKELALVLTPGMRRAAVNMTAEYQLPGDKTFNANGAHMLYYQQAGGGRGFLCDYYQTHVEGRQRKLYRLTPIGVRVANYIRENLIKA